MWRAAVVFFLLLVTGVVRLQAQTQTGSNPQADTTVPTGTPEERIYRPKEEGVTAPRLIYSPDPEYPRKGRNGLKEGTIVLQLVVGKDGLPRDISVTRGAGPGFDQAAIDAVKKWKFKPATKDGKAVLARITVQMFIKGIW